MTETFGPVGSGHGYGHGDGRGGIGVVSGWNSFSDNGRGEGYGDSFGNGFGNGFGGNFGRGHHRFTREEGVGSGSETPSCRARTRRVT